MRVLLIVKYNIFINIRREEKFISIVKLLYVIPLVSICASKIQEIYYKYTLWCKMYNITYYNKCNIKFGSSDDIFSRKLWYIPTYKHISWIFIVFLYYLEYEIFWYQNIIIFVGFYMVHIIFFCYNIDLDYKNIFLSDYNSYVRLH